MSRVKTTTEERIQDLFAELSLDKQQELLLELQKLHKRLARREASNGAKADVPQTA